MPTTEKAGKKVQRQPAVHPFSAVRPPANCTEKYRERLAALFADIERVSCDSANVTPEIRLEIEALRTRLIELEKEVLECKETAAPPITEAPVSPAAVVQPLVEEVKAPAGARILYEPEQIGFVYAEDKLEPVHDASDLPNIPSAITAPLINSGQPIGKVQLAPSPERTWTAEETDVVHAVAQQASLQIQSLRLLAETERARAEAESASRRFIHEGWATYLDAIHQNERIGFAYDQASVKPFTRQPDTMGIQELVSVMDEQVGALSLTPDPNHPLTEGDREMVAAVARQVAQQVENIRLLADASRARVEADEAIKRITRENWSAFTAQKEEKSLGFAYDTNQVTPFGDQPLEDVSLSLPLMVNGEMIGRLAVAGRMDIPTEDTNLAAVIAVQTSTHLETLRLNEELQKRAAELLELDRLKSGFLANMSHELRTPLNSILGFSDVILEGLDGPLTPNMSTDLQLIQKNGQHLLHLINDVLDMSKIEAGRMNLNPEKLKVQEILEEVTSITSTLANEKQLNLFIEPGSDHEVEITADRTRLRQVMINLINNAIKFTERGSIAICVVRKDIANIQITVKDTGVGIPPDKLELVFQEFSQVDTSTTRKAGGTGLGLPISRRLVEMHGGLLWAESSGIAGEGSTFFVDLPIVARIADVVEMKAK